jgi:hypothetical protein
MQNLEGSGTPDLYIGRTVLKGYSKPKHVGEFVIYIKVKILIF